MAAPKSKVISAMGFLWLQHGAFFRGDMGLQGRLVFICPMASWTNLVGGFGVLGQNVPFQVTAFGGSFPAWPAPATRRNILGPR